MKPKLALAAKAIIKWGGEALVGLIPLFAYQLLQIFSKQTVKLLACPVASLSYPSTCQEIHEGAAQEVCILTVVISGLALWSLLTGDGKQRGEPFLY